MGVKDNHTKYEQETQWWRPGTGVASGGPWFPNPSKMQKKKKSAIFLLVCNGCLGCLWRGPFALEPT